jgi:hypothetical protein
MTTRKKALAALVLGMLLAAGGVSWFFLRTKGIVDETLSLQTRLLAGELTARDRRSGVAQVTRNIDKMDREDVKKVRDAFTADWRRLQQQGIDDYFAAGEADREALLDHDIQRLVTAGERPAAEAQEAQEARDGGFETGAGQGQSSRRTARHVSDQTAGTGGKTGRHPSGLASAAALKSPTSRFRWLRRAERTPLR